MGEFTQENRRLQIDTPLGKDVVVIIGLNGTEAISRLFSFQLDLIAENKTNVAFDKLLGKSVTVHLDLPDDTSKRHINGICIQMTQGERGTLVEDNRSFTAYRMELVPKLWRLSQKAQSRIFQQMSVPDILKKVLGEHGVEFTPEIQGTFHPRDYCVQYRETDFNFVSRLMEEEGIFYFFKHSDGSHNMVLANSPGSHPTVPGPAKLIYENSEGGLRDEDRIHDWAKIQALRPGKYLLWDHTFELPHKHLEAEKTTLDAVMVGTVSHKLKVGENEKLEIYDFPGEYAQRFDGVDKGGGDRPSDLQHVFEDKDRTVGIRMGQEETPDILIKAGSTVRHLVSGHKFTLERHFNGNGEYVIVSLSHAVIASADYRSGTGQEFQCRNTFTCIPMALPFVPPRSTPRPFVQGTQTAVVVGPPGEELFTDKYGRVKVQFHWDREGKNNADSSCWIRVGQLISGRRWGASFWPRIGQEVIVAFQEGDPDQPIIVGSVYNADQMPPYLGDGPDPAHKKDNKVMGIKSNTTSGGSGFNEIRFDDTKSKQQVFLHAERNMDVRVKNDSMESVLNDKHLTVGREEDGAKKGDFNELIYRDRTIHVKRHQVEHLAGNVELLIGKGDEDGGHWDVSVEKKKTETIGEDYDLHVKGSVQEAVDGNLGLAVGASRSESVSGAMSLKVGGDRKESVSGSQSLSVGGSQDESVGGKHAVEAGREIHLKAGMKVILEAGVQITLKGPGGFVDIGPAGVTIQGTMVLINSGGAPGSGSGAGPASPDAPAQPKDAKEAKPTDPTVADDAKTGQKSS